MPGYASQAGGAAAGTLEGSLGAVGGVAWRKGSEVGKELMTGVQYGVDANKWRAEDAAVGAVQGAAAAAKAWAKIGSPSRLFADEIGLPIVEGIAVGITEGMPGVGGAVDASVAAVMDRFGAVTPTISASVLAGTHVGGETGGGAVDGGVIVNINVSAAPGATEADGRRVGKGVASAMAESSVLRQRMRTRSRALRGR
jgi:hypothetical protein